MTEIGPFAEAFAGPPAGSARKGRMSQRVGIIGFGAIAQDLVGILAASESAPALCVLVRAGTGAGDPRDAGRGSARPPTWRSRVMLPN